MRIGLPAFASEAARCAASSAQTRLSAVAWTPSDSTSTATGRPPGDRERPALKHAFERWLDPENFGAWGNRRESLSALTRAATASS